MTHILASWELGLRYGHVATLQALAAPFAQAGHVVTLAAKDLPTVAALPQSDFARVLQAPLYLRRRIGRAATITYGQVIEDAGFGEVAALVALVGGWRALFDLAKPDLVVADHAPVSLIAAYVSGIPAVRVGTPFSAPAAIRPMPRFVSEALVPTEADANPDHKIDAVVDAVLQRFGRPAVDGIAGLLGQSPEFTASWPELDFSTGRSDRRYYGPLASFGGTAVPDWYDGRGPRTFVYLPFDHPAAAAVIEVLAARGWPTIWHSQGAPAAPLPGLIRYTQKPVDVDAILAGAAVIVGRAGHGLATAALRHGVPSLVFPDTLEAGLVASCLIREALAVMPRQPSAPAVAAGLGQLLSDPRVRLACDRARNRYGRYDALVAARRMASDMLAATDEARRTR
jgi:UDP:flavonoid glycosyltransferase YjiC (YdhE family)